MDPIVFDAQWWIGAVELPILGGLYWLIWRTRQEAHQALDQIVRDRAFGAAGDRVVIDPNIACGSCRACRRGLTNLCAALRAYGVTEPGGFHVWVGGDSQSGLQAAFEVVE